MQITPLGVGVPGEKERGWGSQWRLGSCNGKENAEAALCASSDSWLVECYVFSGCFSCCLSSIPLPPRVPSTATPAAQFALWHRSRLACGIATQKFGNTVRTLGKEIIKTNVALLRCDAGQKRRTEDIGQKGALVSGERGRGTQNGEGWRLRVRAT